MLAQVTSFMADLHRCSTGNIVPQAATCNSTHPLSTCGDVLLSKSSQLCNTQHSGALRVVSSHIEKHTSLAAALAGSDTAMCGALHLLPQHWDGLGAVHLADCAVCLSGYTCCCARLINWASQPRLHDTVQTHPQRKYAVLQPLLQHWLELEQCIPVATHCRPAGMPAAMPFSLTAPFVICTVSLADSVRAMMWGAAARASSMARARICLIGRTPVSSACTGSAVLIWCPL